MHKHIGVLILVTLILCINIVHAATTCKSITSSTGNGTICMSDQWESNAVGSAGNVSSTVTSDDKYNSSQSQVNN